ncbi:MAG TPA: metalloregulator ArsR/SmtB family transcription factor [Burkholderiales bacterium]|nr:metalloregulator ArsR/SmtB family transcription factor [Burkholderiales bacterium]
MNRADPVTQMNLEELEARALRAAGLLKAMANPVRLRVLCQLAEGEKSVGELEQVAGVSQSALSQHLALLRQRGLVKPRRAGQAVFYALAGAEAPALLAALYEVYCSKTGLVGGLRRRRRQAA